MESDAKPNQGGYDKKRVVSWAFYDWANSAFATTVLGAFFPTFFKRYWNAGVDNTTSTYRLGTANSIAGLIVMLAAPILGAIADRGSARKRLLGFFALSGILASGALYFVSKGNWTMAAVLFIVGVIGFSGGNLFYDSLLLSVCGPKKVDFVSALGYAFGYLGGGILYALNLLMFAYPETFGLADSTEAVKLSFITVAIWWGVFSIPLMLFVKESRTGRVPPGWEIVTGGFRQFIHTFREVRNLKVVFAFLLGYWFYIDGVDTVIRMAADYGLSIGFSQRTVLVAFLIAQIVGFPAAIAFGKLGEKMGPKTGIFIGIAVYTVITIWACFMTREIEFYLLSICVGLVQGGVQSLSRSLYARLVPKNKSAEFFGFYNMLGKFAAVLGPFMMGKVGLIFKDPRPGIFSIVLLFIAGGVFLRRVDVKEGIRMAEALEQAES